MKKRAFVLAVAAISILAMSGCNDKEKSDQIKLPILDEGKIEFNTVKAEIGTISETYTLDGSFENPYIVSVAAGVGGKIESVNLKNGASVKEGDVLLTIVSEDVDKQINDQQIRLDSVKQTYQTLSATSGISAAELESAKIDIDIEQNAMDKLLKDKEKYSVKASASGVISTLSGSESDYVTGSVISQGEIVCKITPSSGNVLCARTNDKNSLRDVNFGTSATITHLNETVGTGIVSDIIYVDNGDYSNYCYVIKVDDKYGDISYYEKPKVTFNTYTKENVVLVPTDAVRNISNEQYVDVLIDGVKVQTAVETGISDELKTEIVSGLTGTEDIIVN